MITQDKATPLQRTNQELFQNRRVIDEMVRLKNSLFGLSPETRELWLKFKESVWKDYKFKKDQRELYREETATGLKEVHAANMKLDAQRRKANRSRSPYSCTRCNDRGTTTTKSGGYCKCPVGIKLFRLEQLNLVLQFNPKWKLSDDKKMAICEECGHAFAKVTKHPCEVVN